MAEGLRAGMTGGRGGAFRSYLSSRVHQSGADWAKWNLGFGKYAGKGWARLLGPAFTLEEAYRGYKEGGVWGAIGGAGSSVVSSYIFGAAVGAIAPIISTPGAVVGGAVLGGMAAQYLATGVKPWDAGGALSVLARPKVAEHMRKYATLEMGRPIMDQFGTLATMRQRSLMAIQNSKVNGRSALGQEAALQFRPYFR